MLDLVLSDRRPGLDEETLYVTYCVGPHCNGATKGAAKLAALGYRAKEMIGGLPGWETDGLPVETGPPAEARSAMQNGSREIST